MLDFLNRNSGVLTTIYRMALFGFVCLGLYGNSLYLRRSEWEEAVKEQRHFTERLNTQLSDLTTELKILRERRNDDEAQNRTLGDHEARLREIERALGGSWDRPQRKTTP